MALLAPLATPMADYHANSCPEQSISHELFERWARCCAVQLVATCNEMWGAAITVKTRAGFTNRLKPRLKARATRSKRTSNKL